MTPDEHIGWAMWHARREAEMTQQEVADKIPGLTRENLSAIETGRVRLTVAFMLRWCRAMKIEPEDFVRRCKDGTDVPPRGWRVPRRH